MVTKLLFGRPCFYMCICRFLLLTLILIIVYMKYSSDYDDLLQQSTNITDDDGKISEIRSIYDVSPDWLSLHEICSDIFRPQKQDIFLRNNFWHYFPSGIFTVYTFGAYLDDREFLLTPGRRIIRMFLAISSPLGLEKNMKCKTFYLYLWYNHIKEPVTSTCSCHSFMSIEWWTIENERYGNFNLECKIPEGENLPSYVSLTDNKCDLPHTYIKLTVPEKPIPKPSDLGVCVKAIFGNFTKENITYVISWLETLRAFGITHVQMYYDDLTLDEISHKAFQYYKDTGFLTFEHFANNLYETDKPYVSAPISQSVVSIIVNDCFYRNIHKFSFIAHIDLDEILIPRKHSSFKDLFTDYFNTSIHNINASNTVVRSAYFYSTLYEEGNKNAPPYIPFMRKTYRTPNELPPQHELEWYTWGTRNTGVSKSFQSTKTCTRMFIHGCASVAYGYLNTNRIVFPPSLILSHHYRSQCQVKVRCKYEWIRRINDYTIPDRIGHILSKRVKYVLEKIGYFKNNSLY